MKAKAKEFSAALSRVTSILRTRTTLPILSCVKLEVKEGKLLLTATDLDAFGTSSCPVEGELDPICVDASALSTLVRQADECITLNLKGPRLVVEGNGTARLATQPAEEFPQWPELKGAKTLGLNTADLAACIKGVAWATEPNPKLTIDLWRECVWVRSTDKSIECCATDGKEFAYVNQAVIAVPAEFMFPARQASLFCDALLTGADGIVLGNSWVMTHSDTFKVAIKLAEDKFIPVEYLLHQRQRPIGVFQIARLVQTLQTIKAIGHGEPWMEVILKLEPERLTVTFQGKNNQFERVLPHQLHGEPCRFKIDCERGISVFGHVEPGAMASLGEASIIFVDGDYTYALALLKDNG